MARTRCAGFKNTVLIFTKTDLYKGKQLEDRLEEVRTFADTLGYEHIYYLSNLKDNCFEDVQWVNILVPSLRLCADTVGKKVGDMAFKLAT